MYSLIRPLLFRLDPERAHHLALHLLRWAGQLPPTYTLLRALFEVSDPRLEVEAFGLRFKNPVGLAAGYDKNGVAVKGLSALGFGHVEVGTVTRLPQTGNPCPRIYRVPEAQAFINSMGFPNEGVEALRERATHFRDASHLSRMWIGINIGKGKDTPLDRAAEDYCVLLRQVYMYADYVALNVSSPNTLGLRQLQMRTAMEALLRAVTVERNRLPKRVPLLVKIAPDLTESEIDDILMLATTCGVDGVIATNTTISRGKLSAYAAELKGGLSGSPLCARSTEVIRYIVKRTEGKLPVIGVGGISSAAAAIDKLLAGARLVQVFTGLMYAGPGLVREINLGLLRHTAWGG